MAEDPSATNPPPSGSDGKTTEAAAIGQRDWKDLSITEMITLFWKELGFTGILGILWAIMPAIAGLTLLTNLNSVARWLQGHESGLAVYIAVFVVSAGLGLLPTYAQAILGGWTFGLERGFPAAWMGFAGASIIGYFVARGVARDKIEKKIAAKPKFQAVREALIGGGFWKTFLIVILLRIPPNSPFALTNLLLASTGVRLPIYVLGTVIGMAPRTALAVWLAAKAAETSKNIDEVKAPTWYFIVGGVLMVGVLIVIKLIADRALARLTRPSGSEPRA